jgi:hypothetical protein
MGYTGNTGNTGTRNIITRAYESFVAKYRHDYQTDFLVKCAKCPQRTRGVSTNQRQSAVILKGM